MATTTTERVTFDSRGQKLVGLLHRPVGGLGGGRGPVPAVIVTGSWTTVKEQMPASYAPHLTTAGMAVLTFDFAGFGESDGAPREVESPAAKAEDIKAALRFLSTQSDVDPRRLGAVPICASAGYTALALKDDPGIKSMAMIAPWLHDRDILESLYGGTAGLSERLEQARQARQHFDATGVVKYVAAASNSDPSAAMFMAGDSLDYYLNPRRGAIPQWGGKFAVMAWTEWLTFDPIAVAPHVKVPTLLVSGEQTATPGGARKFAAGLKTRHELVSIDGTQFDFYDDPRTVAAAAAAVVTHLRDTL